MGQYSKLPHGFPHTFFNSGVHFFCFLWYICPLSEPGSHWLSIKRNVTAFFFCLAFPSDRHLRRGQRGTLREEYMTGGAGEGVATTAALPPRSRFTQVNGSFSHSASHRLCTLVESILPPFSPWLGADLARREKLREWCGWFDWTLLSWQLRKQSAAAVYEALCRLCFKIKSPPWCLWPVSKWEIIKKTCYDSRTFDFQKKPV